MTLCIRPNKLKGHGGYEQDDPLVIERRKHQSINLSPVTLHHSHNTQLFVRYFQTYNTSTINFRSSGGVLDDTRTHYRLSTLLFVTLYPCKMKYKC